ncbi:MAG: Trk system potassium transporter TrkA, partial [Clostridium sp.]|nr:Trk system potassium transporter TrkA [Clostridium sp.]
MGYYLAKKLISQGISVKIVEKDKGRCEYLSENLDDILVICGDGTDINLLDEEDIASMDAFV